MKKLITEKDVEDLKKDLKDGEEITLDTLEELSNGRGDDEDE